MNRLEMFKFLKDNPKKKIIMVKDNVGKKRNNKIGIYRNAVVYTDTLCEVMFYIDDLAEFEVIRELKQMSFTEAIKLSLNKDVTIKSTYSNNKYNNNNNIFNFDKEEIDGLWTVEGVYND